MKIWLKSLWYLITSMIKTPIMTALVSSLLRRGKLMAVIYEHQGSMPEVSVQQCAPMVRMLAKDFNIPAGIPFAFADIESKTIFVMSGWTNHPEYLRSFILEHELAHIKCQHFIGNSHKEVLDARISSMHKNTVLPEEAEADSIAASIIGYDAAINALYYMIEKLHHCQNLLYNPTIIELHNRIILLETLEMDTFVDYVDTVIDGYVSDTFI